MSVFAGETSDAGVVQVRGRRLRVRVARRGRHEAAHGARARAHRQERRRHHLQEDRRQQLGMFPVIRMGIRLSGFFFQVAGADGMTIWMIIPRNSGWLLRC